MMKVVVVCVIRYLSQSLQTKKKINDDIHITGNISIYVYKFTFYSFYVFINNC